MVQLSIDVILVHLCSMGQKFSNFCEFRDVVTGCPSIVDPAIRMNVMRIDVMATKRIRSFGPEFVRRIRR